MDAILVHKANVLLKAKKWQTNHSFEKELKHERKPRNAEVRMPQKVLGAEYMKVVTFFSTLLRYAREEAEARKGGDATRIEKATADHEAYRQLCLTADEMRIPRPSNNKVSDGSEPFAAPLG